LSKRDLDSACFLSRREFAEIGQGEEADWGLQRTCLEISLLEYYLRNLLLGCYSFARVTKYA